MATVQATLLKFALMVDPNQLATGTKFAAGTIGVEDGERFSKQRLLDIYNRARMTLVNAMRVAWPKSKLNEAVRGNLIRNNTATFAAGALALPTGYIQTLVLRTGSIEIAVVPTWAYASLIRHESATNLFGFEEGNAIKAPEGSTFLTTQVCLHIYLGVADWALSDVTGGTAVETVSDPWIPELLEVASAIANEQGNADPMALAVQLLTRGANAAKS